MLLDRHRHHLARANGAKVRSRPKKRKNAIFAVPEKKRFCESIRGQKCVKIVKKKRSALRCLCTSTLRSRHSATHGPSGNFSCGKECAFFFSSSWLCGSVWKPSVEDHQRKKEWPLEEEGGTEKTRQSWKLSSAALCVCGNSRKEDLKGLCSAEPEFVRYSVVVVVVPEA